MSGINSITVVGHCGRDPETRYTNNGTAVTNFTIATSERWNKDGEKQEKTEWHRISLFGRVAEVAGEYVQKGDLVGVQGKLETRKWQDKEGVDRYTTEIIARDLFLLQSKDRGEKQAAPRSSGKARSAQETGQDDFDDDIPF